MATKNLRFFDFPDAQMLADGHPRRGMSVVAALSEWPIHTNRRHNGAWTQRYQKGTPVTDLAPIEPDGTSGTTVYFLPSKALRGAAAAQLRSLIGWPNLAVEIIADPRYETIAAIGC